MDPRIRMLTNHEIVVTNEDQLIGALEFLFQKREYFKNLYIFEDRINYNVYKNSTNLSDIQFDCLKMIQKLNYKGSVSLDFTLSEINSYDYHYMIFNNKYFREQTHINQVRVKYPKIFKRLVVPLKFID